MIERNGEIAKLQRLLKQFPVVGIIGPRRVGKTTLARQLAEKSSRKVTVFDLENPTDEARLADPMLTLESLKGWVFIDEVQRRPELFPVLRVLVDRPKSTTRFVVLGSASPDLLKQSSESLAGRIAYHELCGFGLDEIQTKQINRLWLRGGFPSSFLARSERASVTWRQQFIQTFLERDIPQFGITIGASTLRRFWSMLAHYHGQIWNASELARSFGVADTTVRSYLDLLCSTFVVRQLLPWSANIKKRQVRAPKIFLTDTGLLHTLLGIESKHALEGHPKVGASWEGFAISAIIRSLGARSEESYFWATHSGAEIDLIISKDNKLRGFEFKRTTAPKLTKSMQVAMSDLGLTSIDVIYPGRETFHLHKKIVARPLKDLVPSIA